MIHNRLSVCESVCTYVIMTLNVNDNYVCTSVRTIHTRVSAMPCVMCIYPF